MCWHVGRPVLGGNPLYRVSKWRTFEGKKVPLQILSFRVKLRCIPSKKLGLQVAARLLKGKVLQGFIFFHAAAIDFFLFSIFH